MQLSLRPVTLGLAIGFLSIFFGIGWAVYITVNHEALHERFSEIPKVASSIENAFVSGGMEGHDHSMHGHDHQSMAGEGTEHKDTQIHDDPIMEIAHERLTRGHLHAMGLGTITIVMSLLLSILPMPDRVKTGASVLIGTGGFFYPFSWIIMGFRTPSLGISGAAETVVPIVGPSLILILSGLIVTVFYLVKSFFSRA